MACSTWRRPVEDRRVVSLINQLGKQVRGNLVGDHPHRQLRPIFPIDRLPLGGGDDATALSSGDVRGRDDHQEHQDGGRPPMSA